MITFKPNIMVPHINFDWKIADQCEKTCPYCIERRDTKYALDYRITQTELDNHERVFRYLNDVVQAGQIEFCGGEPTLHPKGIDYFNALCQNSVGNPDKLIRLVTHGDIDYDKIERIDIGGKKEHLIAISYHYDQVDFPVWLDKVKRIHEKCPEVVISVVIPMKSTNWENIRTNLFKILDENINLHVKLEFNRKFENNVSHESYEYFAEVIKQATETNTFFKRIEEYKTLVVDTKLNKTYELQNSKILAINQPIVPGKTMCNTVQMGIFGNVITSSCKEGPVQLEITKDTTDEEITQAINSNRNIMCKSNNCMVSRHFNTMRYVSGIDFDNELFAEFRDMIGCEEIS